MQVDIEAVAAILKTVGEEEIMPRFRRLETGEVVEKAAPLDFVTRADEEAERVLSARLTDLLPGSIAVGEEAVGTDPGLLGRLGEEAPCWLIDPIDGTINFAHGLPVFATMVALIRGGETVAAWIHDPVHDQSGMGEKGAGVLRDHAPCRMAPAAEPLRWSLCLHPRTLPAAMGQAAVRNMIRFGPLLALHCAGLEYLAMLSNRIQMAQYVHTNPWDHAAGCFLTQEAGGHVARLDGTPYRLSDIDHPSPLVAAASREVWEGTKRDLFEA